MRISSAEPIQAHVQHGGQRHERIDAGELAPLLKLHDGDVTCADAPGQLRFGEASPLPGLRQARSEKSFPLHDKTP